MKNLLIVSATEAEILPLLRFLEANFRTVAQHSFQNERYSVDVLVSGVGMMSTAYSLGVALARNTYDAALQAGIGGCFDMQLPLGSVLGVSSECYADLGAENRGAYIDIFELGFLQKNTYPFTDGKLLNLKPFEAGMGLDLVPAISVNTVSGHSPTIADRAGGYGAVLESMEGIAFHYACLQQQLPFLQIRAVSNYVTPRDRDAWQIGLAIRNLNQHLQDFFSK